jgi:transposase
MSRGKLIVRLKRKGLTNRQIAAKLKITAGGVSSQFNAQLKREGKPLKFDKAASARTPSLKSAVIYLQQARAAANERYKNALIELAWLTLLGEDR